MPHSRYLLADDLPMPRQALHLYLCALERKLTQTNVSELFGIPQTHISDLKHYKLSRFSSERLMHFITLPDKDVEIIIRPKGKGHESGLLSVLVAA